MTPRVAVVTGAARGIGLATARRLHDDGWAVVLTDASPEIAPAAHTLAATEGRAIGVTADVTRPADLDELAAAVDAAFGRLDAVVANAAIGGPSTPLLDTPDDEIARVLDVNLRGALLTLRTLVPLIRSTAGRGSAVLLASIFAQQPVVGAGPYIMSKGAVAGLMHTLSLELAPAITVNAVAPGYIMTEMHREELTFRAAREGTSFDAQVAAVRERIPLERHGEAADVAAAIAFLLSPDAGYITGHTLNVNGGALLS